MKEQRVLNYRIGREDENLSLRNFLRQKGYSLKMLIKLKEGGLTVNGGFHRLIDPVHAGDIIEIRCPIEEHNLVPNGALEVPIVYEDEDLIIFDKPVDMLIHPAGRGFDDALGNYFAFCIRIRFSAPSVVLIAIRRAFPLRRSTVLSQLL